MRFEGKVAVITGGASGIGRGTALAMARRGTDLVISVLMTPEQIGETVVEAV